MLNPEDDITTPDRASHTGAPPSQRRANVAGRSRAAQDSNPGLLPAHLIEKYRFLILLLWVLAVIATGRIAWRSTVPFNPTAAVVGVDPNTAPWWDLTALPGVGIATAQNIISFRESAPREAPGDRIGEWGKADTASIVGTHFGAGVTANDLYVEPAFRNPMDLTRVRGIGPRTVQRMAPHLRFVDVHRNPTPTRSDE